MMTMLHTFPVGYIVTFPQTYNLTIFIHNLPPLALSNWTIATEAAGSLPSFEKVRKLWNSPLDSHKEVCAVLTAITEVIKSQVRFQRTTV